METTTETFYGNGIETYYVDQFSRIWLVQSVDFTGEIQYESHTELPSGLEEVDGYDLEMPDAVFELPESAKKEIIAQAKTDAQLFVDEFNEQLNPAKTDWDSEGFNNCKFSFHTDDQITYNHAWSLYQSTLVKETQDLVA